MGRLLEVRRGVPIDTRVAAPDVAAFQAQTQVDPVGTHLDAGAALAGPDRLGSAPSVAVWEQGMKGSS